MSTVGNTFNAVNLFYNGCFELHKDEIPAIWEFEGLDGSGASSYERVERGIEVTLGSRTTTAMAQTFAGDLLPFDFPVPLPGGVRSLMAPGYDIDRSRVLPRNVPLTISCDISVTAGIPGFRAFWVSGNGTRHVSQEEYIQVIVGEPLRLHFVIEELEDVITSVGVEMQAQESAVFNIDTLQLSVGTHSALPYTGDFLQQVFPAGCIVMTLGEACPPGFAALGEDELQPLAEWTENEPGARAREGNYPRTGGDLSGTALHTPTDATVRSEVNDFTNFEGFDGYLAENHTVVDGETNDSPDVFTTARTNPDVDRPGAHTHEIGSAGTRPVSVGLNFCRRL